MGRPGMMSRIGFGNLIPSHDSHDLLKSQQWVSFCGFPGLALVLCRRSLRMSFLLGVVQLSFYCSWVVLLSSSVGRAVFLLSLCRWCCPAFLNLLWVVLFPLLLRLGVGAFSLTCWEHFPHSWCFECPNFWKFNWPFCRGINKRTCVELCLPS